MTDEIQKVVPQKAQIVPLEFTSDQRQMILSSFLNGASESEASVLLELARLRRLNPITKQIHFVKRWDSQRRTEVWSAQVGIDGFRAIAERTGLYDGQDEPEFEYDDRERIRLCRVRVYRKDWGRPAVGVAHLDEYAQRTKDGGFTSMWNNKPHIMLAKCAEALAFRKAFPEESSGLYSPEEMPAEERELNAPPAPTALPKLQVVDAIPHANGAEISASEVTAGKVNDSAVKHRIARVSNLWQRAQRIGLNAQSWRELTMNVLGHMRPSADWTDVEIKQLDGEIKQAETQMKEPGTDG